MDLERLRKQLSAYFNLGELQDLCFGLDISYENLQGETLDAKTRELVQYCERRGLLAKLVKLCRKSRPYVAWSEPPSTPKDKPRDAFSLKFANRETEKAIIRKFLDSDFHVQIHAPGGLGKTYLLREICQEMKSKGWRTVWIDLVSEEHRSCRADRYTFLQEVAQQLFGDAAPDIADYEESKALDRVGRHLADLDKVILFIDNADRADRRLLEWIRATFLESLSITWLLPVRVVASGQQTIPEWEGHRVGRPFRELSLSSFEDPFIIRSIIADVSVRFGAKRARDRQVSQDKDWQADLEIMTEGLFQVTCGHPLTLERVLRYAVEKDGLVHPTFFTDNQTELCDRCLTPIVGERILPTVDRSIREAFRSLCVFRFVWPTLIRTLVEVAVSDDLGGPWEPFSYGSKPWQNWWSELQATHLIHTVGARQMFPISSTVRQVIALVLKTEDEALYQARNRRARQEYERLLASSDVSLLKRAACILEIIFHITQDGSLAPQDASQAFTQLFTDFLADFATAESFLEAATQLSNWLREDAELKSVVNQFADNELYNRLIEIIEVSISDWKGAGL